MSYSDGFDSGVLAGDASPIKDEESYYYYSSDDCPIEIPAEYKETTNKLTQTYQRPVIKKERSFFSRLCCPNKSPAPSGDDYLKMAVCWFSVLAILAAVYLGTFVQSFLLVYTGFNHGCQNDNIKSWAILMGTVSIINLVLSSYTINPQRMMGEMEKVPITIQIINGLLFLFEFIWLIVGTVWYSSYDVGPNYAYCDKMLIQVGQSFIILWWIVLSICMICGGLIYYIK